MSKFSINSNVVFQSSDISNEYVNSTDIYLIFGIVTDLRRMSKLIVDIPSNNITGISFEYWYDVYYIDFYTNKPKTQMMCESRLFDVNDIYKYDTVDVEKFKHFINSEIEYVQKKIKIYEFNVDGYNL